LIRKYILAPIIWLIYNLLAFTWKLTVIEPPELVQMMRDRKSFIMAHWHGDELVLLALIHKYRIATIASTSKDGEMMNTIIRMKGVKTSRGSSTRGAVSALKGLLRLVKSGRNASFAVDGPKGPLHEVKAGVFELSRLMDAPIFWSGVSADRAWKFEKSWNKTYLPKPFAKVRVHWFGPMAAVTKNNDPRDPEIANRLADALRKAQETARKEFAGPLG
jgi:lysophospholipid acyltransferase (LPLAT)-like uncharacterized protein